MALQQVSSWKIWQIKVEKREEVVLLIANYNKRNDVFIYKDYKATTDTILIHPMQWEHNKQETHINTPSQLIEGISIT